jgi:hypothetical protein
MSNRLAALTGEARYARAAERTVELFYPGMRDRPAGFAQLALALEELLAPAAVLVLRGEGPELEKWSSALAREFLPGMLTLVAENNVTGLPAVLDKPVRPEPVNGWLCRGVSCLAPISDLAALRSACKGVGLG